MSVISLTFLPRGSVLAEITAPAVPSLRPFVPSGSLTRCQPVHVYHHHLCSFPRAMLWGSLLSFRRKLTPPQCPVTHFPQPDGELDCSLRDLQSESLPDGLVECPLASCTWLPPCASVLYSLVAFRAHPSSLESPSFMGSSWNIVPAWSLTTATLARCRNSTAGHPSAGGGQYLSGPTIALGPFLQLSEAPYRLMAVPISLLQCSDSFHGDLFFRDFLPLRLLTLFLLDLPHIRGLRLL
jgi:hypothetical protein